MTRKLRRANGPPEPEQWIGNEIEILHSLLVARTPKTYWQRINLLLSEIAVFLERGQSKLEEVGVIWIRGRG